MMLVIGKARFLRINVFRKKLWTKMSSFIAWNIGNYYKSSFMLCYVTMLLPIHRLEKMVSWKYKDFDFFSTKMPSARGTSFILFVKFTQSEITVKSIYRIVFYIMKLINV